jgi:hypothetical protein
MPIIYDAAAIKIREIAEWATFPTANDRCLVDTELYPPIQQALVAKS